MIYLASPYSSPDSDIMKQRYYEASRFTMRVLMHNIPIFSPIVYGRYLEKDIGTTFEAWQIFNDEMIRRCPHFWVLTLKGYENSRGVQHEIALAISLDKPIRYVTMNEALT